MKKLIAIFLALLGVSSANATSQNPAKDLRDKFLSLPNTEFTVKYKDEPLGGIIMDQGLVDGSNYSLLVMIDGATSIYLSNGSVMIGGGEHEEVKKISLEYFELAKQFLSQSHEVKDFPLPQQNKVIFYFITPDKILASDELQIKDFKMENPQFYSLYNKAQNVITTFRLKMQQMKKDGSLKAKDLK